MRTAAQWLEEYGASQRNPTNELLHWICVPLTECCVVIPFPALVRDHLPVINWAGLAIAAALLYYAALSRSLALGALLLML